jgi:protein-disulfide isomerase
MSTRRILGNTINLLLLILVLFLALRSGSPVRAHASQWYEAWAARSFLSEAWDSSVATGSALGADSRPIVVEFADYQCVYCSQQHEILEAFLSSNPDVSIGFRHLPILGEPSVGAARAAVCAEEQELFAKMHTTLFENQEWRDEQFDWLNLAREVGIPNLQDFEDCLASPETQSRLQRDKEIADRLRLAGTPSFVSRTTVHRGLLSAEELEALITPHR